jgi:predicted NBD/HSP70 family sugar kinase
MLDVLRHVHAYPATTRAELARDLGLSRGLASEITGRLRALELVEETYAERTGGRGRPTRALGAHPGGPVVAAVDISHEAWRLAVGTLGGEVTVLRQERPPERRPEPVLAAVGAALTATARDLGGRLRAVGVALPGIISGGRLLQASHLGWQDVDVVAGLPQLALPVVIGNDATLGGVTEARRGAGIGADIALHLTVEVGLGGALLDHGRPVAGSTGAGGEFGHLPFGDPARHCPCGADGCWDLDFDGRTLVRRLGVLDHDDPRTATEAVVDRARAGDPGALAIVHELAASLGRGTAGLVNALDPRVVTLSGLAAAVLDVAGPQIEAAYRRGLMRFRRRDAPAVIPARFPEDGALRGAAELAFDVVLSEAGIDAWLQART